MTTCKVCGTEQVATYRQSNGRLRYRRYCREHWNELQSAVRLKSRQREMERGITGEAQFVYPGTQRPRRGVLRVVVYLTSPGGAGRHREGATAHKVILYAGDWKQTYDMRKLKRLNSPENVLKHLSGVGYQVVKQTKRQIVLEKAS